VRATLRIVKQPRLLLVEGMDDVNIVAALAEARGVTGVQIESTQGKDGLRDDLIAWTLTDGFVDIEWLGILQDGDEHPDRRFESIAGQLRSRGLPVPESPWLRSAGLPTTFAAVIVNDTHGNDMEGIVLAALAERSSERMRCVDELFGCNELAGEPLPRQRSKARIRGWLSTHEPPTMTLGYAAQRGMLPLDHSAFDQLANILSA